MVLVRSLGKGRSAVPGCAWMRLAKPVVRPRQSSGQVDAQRPRRLPATMQRVKASTTKAARVNAHGLALASGLHLPRSVASSGGTNCPGSVEAHLLAGWAAAPGSGG